MIVEQRPAETLAPNGYARGGLAALLGNQMLQTLGKEEIAHVIDIGRRVVFEPDAIVSRQSTPVSEVQFIIQGRAKAEISPPSHGSFVAVLNLLRPGDDIGLLSLINGAAHSPTVTALEHLHVLSNPMADMRALLHCHVEWYMTLAEVAVTRLRNSSTWLQSLM